MEDPVLYDIQNIFHFKIYLGTASIHIPLCDTNAHIYTSRHIHVMYFTLCVYYSICLCLWKPKIETSNLTVQPMVQPASFLSIWGVAEQQRSARWTGRPQKPWRPQSSTPCNWNGRLGDFFAAGGWSEMTTSQAVSLWESWETMKQSPAKWEDNDFYQFKNDSNHQKSLSLQQNEKLLMPLNWMIGATGYNQKGDRGPLAIQCHQWKCDPWVIRHIICPKGFV